MHIHKCLLCLKPFTTKRSDGKYCSKPCNDRHYRIENAENIAKYKVKWQKDNESYKEYKAKWHQDNKEHNSKITEIARKKRLLADPVGERAKNAKKMREWRLRNKARHLATQRKAGLKRRQNPKYRLSQSVAQRMRDGLRGNKTDSFADVVGYSINELADHLKGLFDIGMTWNNYGSYWHVDHIIPVSVFSYETPSDRDFQRCWSLENLRPLEAKENISKGCKLGTAFQPSLLI